MRLAAALLIGGSGGALFATFQLPLPWLLGAMATTTIASLAGLSMAVPDRLRAPMIALLGVMLGTTFTPERVESALSWLPTLGALLIYVVVVGAAIWFYRRPDRDEPDRARPRRRPHMSGHPSLRACLCGGSDRPARLGLAQTIRLAGHAGSRDAASLSHHMALWPGRGAKTMWRRRLVA